MEYIKCELRGGGSPRLLNTFPNLYIFATHDTHQYMLCIVANADCIHVESATASYNDLVALHRRTLPTKQSRYFRRGSASYGLATVDHELN